MGTKLTPEKRVAKIKKFRATMAAKKAAKVADETPLTHSIPLSAIPPKPSKSVRAPTKPASAASADRVQVALELIRLVARLLV